jgi:hypothetical protein
MMNNNMTLNSGNIYYLIICPAVLFVMMIGGSNFKFIKPVTKNK